MPNAISYVRWSSAKQGAGDSFRRQSDTERFCQQHGLTLLSTTYKDAGVSSFKGKNRDQGALGCFIQACDDGLILPGTVLIVEQLDRLSRMEADLALSLFGSILRRGILIGHVRKNRILDSTCLTGLGIFEFAVEIVLANTESQNKSERVHAAWLAKQKNAAIKKLTKRGPSWLTLSEDRTHWIVDEAKAATVRRIFQLCADGGLGIHAISKKLSLEKVPPIGGKGKWSNAIRKILRQRYVLGEYQPRGTGDGKQMEPFQNYYPAIIEEPLYYRAQQALDSRFRIKGRLGKSVPNLFSGLLHNRADDSPMHINDKSPKGTSNYKYLIPSSALYEAGERWSVRLELVEAAILGSIQELTMIDTHEPNQGDTLPALHDKLATLEARFQLATDAAENADDFQAAMTIASKLGRSISEAKAQIEAVKTASATTAERALSETKTILEAMATDGSYEMRLGLRGAIRRLIAKIVLQPMGKEGVLIGLHYRNGMERGISLNKQTGEYQSTPIF